MRRRGWFVRGVVVFALVGFLMLCGVAAIVYAQPPSASARALALGRAEERWAARPFSHYRMVVQAASWCRLDVEVQDEHLVRVFEDTCPGPPPTVTDLFARIKLLERDHDRIFCAPAGCECTEVRFVLADYDVQLGFPRSISVRRPRAANWQGLWGYLLEHGLPNCLTPRDIDIIRVLSFRPMS